MCRLLPLFFVLALPVLAGDDKDDPEPPGSSAGILRKLKGSWTVSHAIFKGKDVKPPKNMTYLFDGDKMTIDTGLGKGQAKKVKIDARKRPFAITLTMEGSDRAQEGIFKFEKGQLYLALSSPKSAKAPTTFDGESGPVLVLTPVKK